MVGPGVETSAWPPHLIRYTKNGWVPKLTHKPTISECGFITGTNNKP
jgi:hypothetical protein